MAVVFGHHAITMSGRVAGSYANSVPLIDNHLS